MLQVWKQSCQEMEVSINENYLFTLDFADDEPVIVQDSYDME